MPDLLRTRETVTPILLDNYTDIEVENNIMYIFYKMLSMLDRFKYVYATVYLV